MKTNCTVSEISHAELVDFLSTVTYGDSNFETYIDKNNNHLTDGEGDCYEDELANVLLNGGYICVMDCESFGDKEPYNTRCENKPFFNKNWQRWVYKVNLNDIKRAFGEIISGNVPSKETEYKYPIIPQRYILMREMKNFINGEYDFYDCFDIYQYVFLNEIVYA